MTFSRVVALAACLTIASGASAFAAVNLVQNGDFETTSLTSSTQIASSNNAAQGGQVAYWNNTASSGYTGTGYTFLIQSGTADTSGFTSLGGNHDYLWGPGGGTSASNYSNNGLTANSAPVGGGGNYIIADGDPNFSSALWQSVSGLTIGQEYFLTFDWAGAEFAGFNSVTTESWNVSFGNQSASTPVITTPAKGFSPWRQQTMAFVATATTQVLSFLAVGSPNGAPPTSLLDSVSLVAAPEPSTWAVVVVGLGGVMLFTRSRKRNRSGATAA